MKPIQALHTIRRTIFEALGSDRHSHPGLNGLDRKIENYLPLEKGVFVEAGANDGFTQSNTYHLERFKGWTGVLVEGIPELYKKAKRLRRGSKVFNCVLVPFADDGKEMEMVYGNLMSLVSGAMGSSSADATHINNAKKHDKASGSYKVKVIGRALSNVLDEAGLRNIDLLSLDVEGFEAQVLEGIDFNRHLPKVICVEAREKTRVHEILSGRYDLAEELSAMDMLYIRK